MKKLLVLTIILSILVTTISCNVSSPNHQQQRLTDYGPAKWISTNPDIWFEVIGTDDKLSENEMFQKGQIMLENRTIDFTMDFDGGVSVYFYNADGKSGMLFNGTCKFNPESLEVKINKKSDTVFNGEFDKIVFDRETKNISE